MSSPELVGVAAAGGAEDAEALPAPAAELPAELRDPQGFASVWPTVQGIDGWLSREQAAALYAAAGAVRPGNWIVELGSHQGRSTMALAKGKRGSVGLLAVDPFPPPPFGHGSSALGAFLSNLRRGGVDRDVHLFRGSSRRAADAFGLLTDAVPAPGVRAASARGDGAVAPDGASIGLLFVDALHDRSSVLDDISRWEPLVGDGGLVCFHDAFFRLGVTLAVLQRHLMSTEFRYVDSVGNLAIFRRERLGTTPAVISSLRLLSRLSYWARNVIVTIAIRRNWRWLLRRLPPEPDFEY